MCSSRQVRPSMVLLQLPPGVMGGAAAQLATAPAAACLCGLHMVRSNLNQIGCHGKASQGLR